MTVIAPSGGAMQNWIETERGDTITVVAFSDRVGIGMADGYGETLDVDCLTVAQARQLAGILVDACDGAEALDDERAEKAAVTLAADRGIPLGTARRLLTDGLIDPAAVLTAITP